MGAVSVRNPAVGPHLREVLSLAGRLGLARQRLLAFTLPGFGTTARTRGNAKALMAEMGVTATEIVSPTDLTVLQSDGHEILTLVTCYPFYFVGPAPDRFIVRAARVIGST
jgi:hypothetical protein